MNLWNALRCVLVASIAIGVGLRVGAAADDKAPTAKLTFAAKNGNVTFDHSSHIKREKNDCKTCHDNLFQEASTAPLNFTAGMHKPAETAKTSCGFCHHAGGNAFESKGNCAKCHVKA